MKKKIAAAVVLVIVILACIIGYYLYRMWPMLSTTMGEVENTEEHQSHLAGDQPSEEENVSTVYMTTEISPEGLMNAYQALGVELTGENTAVKLSTGEPGSNYLDPDLIKDLVQYVNGTIVECNTAYQGSRTETQMHYQVAEDHGFTDIADFVIMDEDGSVSIPVEGGNRMTENLVGAHFPEYDGFLVLSHFKGHAIAGFGGAIKNISIGMASQEGKCLIHTDGVSHTSPWGGAQDPFLECMAEDGGLLGCRSRDGELQAFLACTVSQEAVEVREPFERELCAGAGQKFPGEFPGGFSGEFPGEFSGEHLETLLRELGSRYPGRRLCLSGILPGMGLAGVQEKPLMMFRVLDVEGFLSCCRPDGREHFLRVADPLLPENSGCYVWRGGDGQEPCARRTEEAEFEEARRAGKDAREARPEDLLEYIRGDGIFLHEAV